MKGLSYNVSHEHQELRVSAPASDISEVFVFEDDFFHFDPTAVVGDWVVGATDGTGAALAIDSAGGWIQILLDGGADNNETYYSTMAEVFQFLATKKLSFMVGLCLTEVNVDDANWIAGLSDTVAANSLVDNGAGPMANFDGAVFYKVDGSMRIRFCVSNGAVQTLTDLCPFVTAHRYIMGFDYDYMDGVTANIYPWVVDTTAGTVVVEPGSVHSHIAIAACGEMHALLGAKTGAVQVESLFVDFVKVWQQR